MASKQLSNNQQQRQTAGARERQPTHAGCGVAVRSSRLAGPLLSTKGFTQVGVGQQLRMRTRNKVAAAATLAPLKRSPFSPNASTNVDPPNNPNKKTASACPLLVPCQAKRAHAIQSTQQVGGATASTLGLPERTRAMCVQRAPSKLVRNSHNKGKRSRPLITNKLC